jgi:hypothetical protein
MFGPGDDGESQSSQVNACTETPESFRFEHGTDGHADPLGAAAASQARAGRIRRAQDIAQPADARHKIRPNDFVLANDKIAVYIEAEGASDGYFPYGGEILGIEPIGPDGRPQGVSYYGEGTLMFGLQTISPERVSVLADGSDGGPAIVRASGTLKMIPVLDTFIAVWPDMYNFPVALDYILEPGASRVKLRFSVANTRPDPVDFSEAQHLGFFQGSRSQTFYEGSGFGRPPGDLSFVAWESDTSSFMVHSPLGPVASALDISGLQVFRSPPLSLKGCEKRTADYLEITASAGGIDKLLETKRKTYAEPAWREVRGVVREAGGGVLPGTIVHATSQAAYLTRAVADAHGAFVLHVPPGPVEITPTNKGWAIPAARPLAEGATTMDLTLPRRATIEVDAVDSQTQTSLPVRVQIISTRAHAPESFGVKDEPDDRLYREYVMDGHTSLPVPPGSHRIVVSRGYEYEIFDAPIVAEEGRTTKVRVALTRSVDSSGVMCADFHIHSIYSADSSDPVEKKVRGAIADGLEIPVSTEHEYVIDFQPTIERLGLSQWAFGMAGEELTTFGWGHFGVFPMSVQPSAPNNGAIDWSWKNPPQLFPEINALPSRPMLIVNHPRSGGMGYFESAGFDPETANGSESSLWSEAFGAVEVFNDSDFEANRAQTVADWFGLLNAGKIRTAVGSSDSHELSKAPVGYPRTCLYFGHDDPRQLSPEKVRDALRAGTAIVSGGLTMTVEGPGGILPGGTSTPGAYKVVIASPGWVSASNLEVIVDGVTTQRLDLDPNATGPGPGKRHEVTINVAPVQSRPHHWVVFHARGRGDLAPLHPGRRPFAVSNPIFF